jgi:hypothetical protein
MLSNLEPGVTSVDDDSIEAGHCRLQDGGSCRDVVDDSSFLPPVLTSRLQQAQFLTLTIATTLAPIICHVLNHHVGQRKDGVFLHTTQLRTVRN